MRIIVGGVLYLEEGKDTIWIYRGGISGFFSLNGCSFGNVECFCQVRQSVVVCLFVCFGFVRFLMFSGLLLSDSFFYRVLQCLVCLLCVFFDQRLGSFRVLYFEGERKEISLEFGGFGVEQGSEEQQEKLESVLENIEEDK